jgi:hypothetical protein
MQELALATGKTLVTVKSWVTKRLVPAPVYRDTKYNHRRYLREEVDVIAATLVSLHIGGYDYFHPSARIYAEVMADVIERVRANYP